MIKILLGLFTVVLIYLIIRFIKIYKNTRQDFKEDEEVQNLDLSSLLNEELSSDADIEIKP